MPATATPPAVRSAVADVLLRHGLVAPGLLSRSKVRPGRVRTDSAAGLVALEADLVALGFLPGPRLRRYLAGQEPERLAELGLGLLDGLARAVGAHVPHIPLFRSFPRRIPADTNDLYVRRIFALLLQEPRQPCVLCGTADLVRPVAPCAHLVCGACWDGSDYTGCPICHRRVDCEDAFLRPTPPPAHRPQPPLPRRARIVELADDAGQACGELTAALLGRRTPLSPADRADLDTLLDHAGPAWVDLLPADIPVRETRAAVVARALTDPAGADRLPGLLDRYVGTATDVLRLLHVLHGADAGLRTPPARRRSLPRRLRRLLLSRLDALPLASLVEDLRRHGARWLRMAENLHPFEEAGRHPVAATAFVVLRRTRIDADTPFGRLVAGVVTAHPGVTVRPGERITVTGWAGRVEAALPAGNTVPLLAARPGELVRRLVAVAHRAGDPAELVDTVDRVAPAVAPGVLLAAIGALRAASWPAVPRLYFPRGGSATLWTEPDHRPRLDAGVAVDLESVLTAEVLRRAGNLPPVDHALLDGGLVDLVAPFTERTASAALVRLPRGSGQPLPPGRRLRLFLHWTEPAGTRVDLDLSVSFYDGGGGFVGWCDYTRLRFGKLDAVHSGDLTSAPPPAGASEFVDLDIAALRRRGIRYVTMLVLSYNDVPFDAMTDAFAGLMTHPGDHGQPFEPRAVEQRFDLAGDVRVAIPLVVDLDRSALRWLDSTLAVAGGQHSVGRYSRTIGRLSAAADRHFTAGHRVSLWELACWQVAARTRQVTVRGGSPRTYRRRDGETVAAFAERLVTGGPADDTPVKAAPDFAALVRADVDLPVGADVYALYPDRLDPARVRQLQAGDLLAALAPTGAA
ncbi:MXAN_6230/SCO0854 family RING domain-containing protein [Polymorphospora lycopeni]|uniref:MXAN_6230/SCO0854 family RING domain-containing protein n=1 Tax=Polymorphospora lycopeni TaxID=3140240 RepID=A0ABV5CQW7_9ACTN